MYMDDEEDWITVEQDDEWVEAKRHLLLANDANFTLRVRIVRHSNSGNDNNREMKGQQVQSSVCRLVHDFEEVITDAIHEGEKHLDLSSVQGFVDKVANEIKNKDSSTRKQVDVLVNQISVLLSDLFDHKGKKRQQQQQQQEEDATVAAAEPQEGPSHPVPETSELLEQPVLDHVDVESPEQPELQIPPSRELQESWTFVEIQNHLMNQLSDNKVEKEEEIEEEEEEDEIIDDVTEEYAPLVEREEEEEHQEEEEVQGEEEVQEEKEEQVVSDVQQQQQQQPHAAPCCRFVEHVSFPECIQMSPDTTFTKTWKLQNTGKEQWPEGVMFAYCEGPTPNLINLQFISRVPRAMPGEVVEVSVQLTSPVLPGYYNGSFRLATRSGVCFGQSFGFEFETVAQAPSPVPAPAPQIPSKWSEAIEQLEAMGFQGRRDELVKLLERHRGNLQNVVLQLIQ